MDVGPDNIKEFLQTPIGSKRMQNFDLAAMESSSRNFGKLGAEAFIKACLIRYGADAIYKIDVVEGLIGEIEVNRHKAFILRITEGDVAERDFIAAIYRADSEKLRYADWLSKALCRLGSFEDAFLIVQGYYERFKENRIIWDWYANWCWKIGFRDRFLNLIRDSPDPKWNLVFKIWKSAEEYVDFPKGYYVNMQENYGRRVYAERIWKGMATLTRLDAVKGRSLPKYCLSNLSKKDIDNPGLFGCFLSHIKIWEMISEEDNDLFLIVEDDAYPLFPFDGNIFKQMIEMRFDLVFLNTRACPPLGSTDETSVTLIDIREAKEKNIGGTYGYVISKNGAIKLIELVRSLKTNRRVDGFMISAVRDGILSGAYSSIPWVEHDDFGMSVRNYT